MRVRRVGFRNGSDAELTALHTVESPVEAERRPDRVPQPLDSYIAFARSLPARFHDHTWVVESDDGEPIGSGACWWDAAGDGDVMECDLMVRRDRRRTGVGSALLRVICETTMDAGRSTLTWSTFGAVPAGEALSRRLGARAARVNRTSELRLDDVDWTMVDRWVEAPRARERGYTIEVIEGVFPEHLREDAATLHHLVQTMPHDDLAIGDIVITADDVADVDRAHVEAGRERWTILARDPEGRCVGGTEVTFEPWEPTVVLQQNTAIDPAHRGLGLAKWVKAAMLELVRDGRPSVTRVRTGNAFSNTPMLAINDALGFVVIETRTEWQAGVADVRAALGS